MAPPRSKLPPSLLLIVVSFALFALIGFQTFRGRKISADLLNEKDLKIETLDADLQKHRKKVAYLQDKLKTLSSQKEHLDDLKENLRVQLTESQQVTTKTQAEKQKLLSSLREKEQEVNDLREKLSVLQAREEELKQMKNEILQKDAEIKELKNQLQIKSSHSSSESDSNAQNSSFVVNILGNGHEMNNSINSVKQDSSAMEERYSEERERVTKEVDDESNSEEGEEGEEKEQERLATELKEDEDESKDDDTVNNNDESEENDEKNVLQDDNEESRDSDKEDAKIDEDGEEALTSKDSVEDIDEKTTGEEEETDEQPDMNVEIVQKSSFEENEIAAE